MIIYDYINLYTLYKFIFLCYYRKLFVNINQAKQRFLGMSFNTFKLGSKESGKTKDLAKSIQTLMSFYNLVLNGEYSPRLSEEDIMTVKEIKFAKKTDSIVDSVKEHRNSLEAQFNNLIIPEYKDSFETLNRLLLDLSGIN